MYDDLVAVSIKTVKTGKPRLLVHNGWQKIDPFLFAATVNFEDSWGRANTSNVIAEWAAEHTEGDVYLGPEAVYFRHKTDAMKCYFEFAGERPERY